MLPPISFQSISWTGFERIIHKGETGNAFWQTIQLPGVRIRMVEYTAGYLADHWCSKGHCVHCVKGEFVSELDNGEEHVLSAGMSYIVSDGAGMHRSYSQTGARLLIIDGDFLK